LKLDKNRSQAYSNTTRHFENVNKRKKKASKKENELGGKKAESKRRGVVHLKNPVITGNC